MTEASFIGAIVAVGFITTGNMEPSAVSRQIALHKMNSSNVWRTKKRHLLEGGRKHLRSTQLRRKDQVFEQ